MRGLLRSKLGKQIPAISMTEILAFVMLSGIITGAIVQRKIGQESASYLYYFVQQTLNLHRDASFGVVMGRFFITCFMLHTVVLFFAFSCIGTPAIAITIFCKGFCTGVLSIGLVELYGAKGMLANLLMFWLPELLRSVCLILFASYATQACNRLFCLHILEKGGAMSRYLQNCEKMFLITAVLYLPCSLVSAVLTLVFSPLFL